jgi:MFS family permease
VPARASLNPWLYFACQVLAASSMSFLVATSAIVGASLTHDPRLATLPLGLLYLATLLVTLPASHLMAALGRRAGFTIGALCGLAGGALGAVAITSGSFALFCAASALSGAYFGFTTFYRFAAAESAEPERRERALGWIMTAGMVAAFLGPFVARSSKDAWSSEFAASYALLGAMGALALVLLQFLRRPPKQAAPPTATPRAPGRASSFPIAIAVGMVASAAMMFVMTATPLAMAGCHHGFDSTADVIQWHVLAMYGPSFVTGRLISRFGASPIVLAGLLACAASAAVHLGGDTLAHFHVGLVLLGLGWNLAYFGSTTMLAAAAPDRRATVQGVGDLLISSAIAVAAILAGWVAHVGGWRAVNLAALPPVGLLAVVIAAHLRADRASQAA